jgi:hypothetical protein
MRLLSAYTPAHTHPETLSYVVEVDDAVLTRSLLPGHRASHAVGERIVDAADREALLSLQGELEAGEPWTLIRAENVAGMPQRLHLVRGSTRPMT